MMETRIKFYARSFDLRLYERSKLFYEQMGFPCVRLTDQTADGYFYTMLADEECDIAINVDEDCFIANPQAVLDLLEQVRHEGYANAGFPDGGNATPRPGNPLVTNPFFNILNLRLIRQKMENAEAIRKQVKEFDYNAHLSKMEAAFPKELLVVRWDFQRTNYEPYYPFFLWLAFHFKTLYLPSAFHDDERTTKLFHPDGRLLCQHTWFARFYSVPSFIVKHWQPNAGKQQKRINARINEVAAMRNDVSIPDETVADTLRYTLDKTIRWIIKVPQRISHWPNKIKRKIVAH